jgi:hypothetical protein
MFTTSHSCTYKFIGISNEVAQTLISGIISAGDVYTTDHATDKIKLQTPADKFDVRHRMFAVKFFRNCQSCEASITA